MHLNSPIISVPFFPVKGEMEHRHFKNSYLSVIAEEAGVESPLVMKEVRRPSDCESWQEYRFDLLNQLKPIVHDNHTYYPLHPTGGSRSVVAFAHEDLEERLLSLCACSEDVIAYLKGATTTEFPYGIHRLEQVHVEIQDDEQNGLLTDGLGYASSNVFKALGMKNIFQMRCFHASLSKAGIGKGLVKIKHELPPNTIRLSRSQLKGKINLDEWNGSISLDIGILRRFEGAPPTAHDSWSFLEYWHDIRDSEIPQAVGQAKIYCDIMKDPLKLAQHRGLVSRDDETMSLVEHLIQIAATSTVNGIRRPRLERHPFLAMHIESICASRLRHLATSGSREFPYPVVTEIMTTPELKIAVKTNLFEPSTEVAILRYPCLEGRNLAYGVVIGPSDSDAEISCGKEIAQICAMDSDGDAVLISDESSRVDLAKQLRATREDTIKKNHKRLHSSLYELPDVIARNLFSAGIGTATLCAVACELAGDEEGRHFSAELTQATTDSIKYSVDTTDGRREAKRLLDQYGLPDHLSHKDDRRAFAKIESTTAYTSSPLWQAVAQTFHEEMGEYRKERLPTRAFTNLLGAQAFILAPEDLKSLTAVFRWYASKARNIHESDSDEEEKARRFADLYDSLRAWKSGLKGDLRQWGAAAWTISNSGSDLNSVGAFAFRVFAEELVPMLAEVYQCKELVWERASSGISKTDNVKTCLPTTAPLAPKFNRTLPNSTTNAPLSIALVNLQDGIEPETIEGLLHRSEVRVMEHPDRPLPALGEVGLYLANHEGDRLCDLADKDIPLYRQLGLIGGDIVTFKNSLKIYFQV